MVDNKWAEFWWDKITDANIVVTKVVSALRDNKMVVLEVPDDLPWRAELRNSIELTLRSNVSSEDFVIQFIDDADDCNGEEPGLFLLNRFAKERDVRTGYRSASTRSIQEYIIDNKVLGNTIIWVKGLDTKRAKDWIKFCKGYNSASITNGLFVLEIKEISEIRDVGNAEKISYSRHVKKFDVQLFNSLILGSEHGGSSRWKNYISTLSAELCGTDAQISAELIDCCDLKTKEPTEGLELICENEEFRKRGSDSESKHILAYYRNGNHDEIKKRIWSAQLKVLFPIIEKARLEYIELYKSEIANSLSYGNVKQFDEIVTVPEDVELGTLHYLVSNHKINMNSQIDRDRIAFLRDCRNKIAHMDYCNIDEVQRLLTKE